MKVKVGIEAKPWDSPNYISLMNNGTSILVVALKDVDVHVLVSMCEQFREDVFKKAGKTDPRVTPR